MTRGPKREILRLTNERDFPHLVRFLQCFTIDLLDLVSIPAAADWNAPITVERINFQLDSASPTLPLLMHSAIASVVSASPTHPRNPCDGPRLRRRMHSGDTGGRGRLRQADGL